MSELTLDTIKNTTGQTLLVNGYPGQTNRIIEYLSSPCDGSQVSGLSGTYTFPLVTAQQGGATTYQVVTGSNIYYQPPIGTKFVKYRFTHSSYWANAHAIIHYKFFIDDTEVTNARFNRSAQYFEDKSTFEYTIQIGGTNNPAVGKFSTWDIYKNLYMTFRWYGTSNNSNLHGTTYWDGASSNQFNMPTLSIIAMA